jgi:hypothetical protein
MDRESALPPGRIASNAKFVIHSEANGVISEHENQADAILGLRAHLKKTRPAGTDEAAIYRRDGDGWRVF